MNSDRMIIGQACVYFAIHLGTLTKADCIQWLGTEPVETLE